MLVGLAFMAVPLLVAILTAVLQIRDARRHRAEDRRQGVTDARASQELFGQIASLERTARLYDVLNDAKLLEVYRTQDERLSADARAAAPPRRRPIRRKTLEAARASCSRASA